MVQYASGGNIWAQNSLFTKVANLKIWIVKRYIFGPVRFVLRNSKV